MWKERLRLSRWENLSFSRDNLGIPQCDQTFIGAKIISQRSGRKNSFGKLQKESYWLRTPFLEEFFFALHSY
jgi:hypothetical protein